jgi:hypothetical protein
MLKTTSAVRSFVLSLGVRNIALLASTILVSGLSQAVLLKYDLVLEAAKSIPISYLVITLVMLLAGQYYLLFLRFTAIFLEKGIARRGSFCHLLIFISLSYGLSLLLLVSTKHGLYTVGFWGGAKEDAALAICLMIVNLISSSFPSGLVQDNPRNVRLVHQLIRDLRGLKEENATNPEFEILRFTDGKGKVASIFDFLLRKIEESLMESGSLQSPLRSERDHASSALDAARRLRKFIAPYAKPSECFYWDEFNAFIRGKESNDNVTEALQAFQAIAEIRGNDVPF